MPLSRPIRNLTKLTQIPHFAPGMVPQALPCLVSSSSNCRNRLQSCSLRSRGPFFFWSRGGRGEAGGSEKRNIEVARAWVAKPGKRARTSRQTARKIKTVSCYSCHHLLVASPLSHSTRHLACLRTHAKPTEGQKRDSFSKQNSHSAILCRPAHLRPEMTKFLVQLRR